MSESKRVQDQIAQAFKRATMPRSARELAPPGIDANAVIEHFLGKTQAVLESGEFRASLYMEDFSYMTCQAVEYYLPSVLRIMMREPADDGLWIYLHGFLEPREDGKLWWNLQELSRKQLDAIAAWAGFLHGQWLEFPSDYLDPGEAERLAVAFRRATPAV